jgi:undecaprenyl-diphosphatase
MFIEILKAILIGIVQGITEWLPVSSTGHMILVENFFSFSEKFMSDYFYKNLFLIVIQLGSILAVVVLFFGKLNPFSMKKTTAEKKGTWILWSKVIVSALPAAVVGLLLDDWLEANVFVDSVVNYVIAVALLLYGVLFIVIEKLRAKKQSLNQVTLFGMGAQDGGHALDRRIQRHEESAGQ